MFFSTAAKVSFAFVWVLKFVHSWFCFSLMCFWLFCSVMARMKQTTRPANKSVAYGDLSFAFGLSRVT